MCVQKTLDGFLADGKRRLKMDRKANGGFRRVGQKPFQRNTRIDVARLPNAGGELFIAHDRAVWDVDLVICQPAFDARLAGDNDALSIWQELENQ